MINNNEVLAYKKIKKKKIDRKINFKKLYKITKKANDPLFIEMKIYMILSIKWHFDYLAKTGQNPLQLNSSLKYWYEIFFIFLELKKQNWIIKKNKKKDSSDIWEYTKKSFNFMWPKTTIKKNFLSSSKLAELRLNQILKMMKINKSFFKDKVILDSGCGPGRYIHHLLKYKPSEIIGVDSGKDIIKQNKIKFKNYKNVKFLNCDLNNLPFKYEKFDFIISAGVLHHVGKNIKNLIHDHARSLKKGGNFFVFIAGKGGQELELWEFCRKVFRDVNIEQVFNKLKNEISPLRLQGLLDHGYGEYAETSRTQFEKILKKNFTKVKIVKGVPGADVTKHLFRKDKFFKRRFGTGNLRYLCIK